MNDFSDQIYKELEEIDSRIYFIEDIYKTIIKQVYQIHPDLLHLSENKIQLSNFIKHFHNQSIPYCEQLQKDLDTFKSIIKRINEAKLSLNSNKTVESTSSDFLSVNAISQNSNVRSVLIDQTENARPTINTINGWPNETIPSLPLVSTPNCVNSPKKKVNNENLIDFSSDSIEKSSPSFEFKNKIKIKKNISYSSLSASQSAGKSSKLSDPSKLKKLNYYILDSSKKFECFVSHVVSPFLFFIQYKEIFYRKEKFEKNINLFYDDPENNENTRVEFIDEFLIYAGRYSEDKKWYRAKVISVNESDKTAQVFYIDYGNSEVLNFEDIRFLDDIFYKESVFALPVSLAMAMPADGSNKWNEEAINEFSDLALYRWSKIETFMIKKWPIFFCHIEIKLDLEKKDALEYLQSRNLAMIENNFIIAEKYQENIQELNNHYEFTIFLPQESGLNQIKDSETNHTSKKHRTSESQSGSFSFKNGEKYRFTIDDLPRKNLNLDSDKTFFFKICEAYSTNEIYVNLLDENFDEYDLYEKELTEFYEKNKYYLARFAAKKKYDFINLNSICVAFSPRDKLWYRAKITNLDKSLIRLIYIDYGTMDYLSLGNLYPLTKQFAAIPPVTIFSTLNQECGKSWTESAQTCFVSSVGKYEFFRAKVKCSDNELSHHFNKALPLSHLKAYDKNENEISFDLNNFAGDEKNLNENELDHFESASCFKYFQNKSLAQPLKIDLPNEDVNKRIKMYIHDCRSYVNGNDSGDDGNCDGTDEAKSTDLPKKCLSETLLKESKKPSDDLLFENWNPMAQEYHSAKNFYGFNEQSGQSHAFGFETLYEKDICEQFNQNGYCNRKKCHLYHKKRAESKIKNLFQLQKFY